MGPNAPTPESLSSHNEWGTALRLHWAAIGRARTQGGRQRHRERERLCLSSSLRKLTHIMSASHPESPKSHRRCLTSHRSGRCATSDVPGRTMAVRAPRAGLVDGLSRPRRHLMRRRRLVGFNRFDFIVSSHSTHKTDCHHSRLKPCTRNCILWSLCYARRRNWYH